MDDTNKLTKHATIDKTKQLLDRRTEMKRDGDAGINGLCTNESNAGKTTIRFDRLLTTSLDYTQDPVDASLDMFHNKR